MTITGKIVVTTALTLVLGTTFLVLTKVRDNDKPTWRNWWDCNGIGASLERESEYSLIYNTCVTHRINADGTVTKVMANLDVGLEGM